MKAITYTQILLIYNIRAELTAYIFFLPLLNFLWNLHASKSRLYSYYRIITVHLFFSNDYSLTAIWWWQLRQAFACLSSSRSFAATPKRWSLLVQRPQSRNKLPKISVATCQGVHGLWWSTVTTCPTAMAQRTMTTTSCMTTTMVVAVGETTTTTTATATATTITTSGMMTTTMTISTTITVTTITCGGITITTTANRTYRFHCFHLSLCTGDPVTDGALNGHSSAGVFTKWSSGSNVITSFWRVRESMTRSTSTGWLGCPHTHGRSNVRAVSSARTSRAVKEENRYYHNYCFFFFIPVS